MAERRSVAVGIFVLGGFALGTVAILLFGGMRVFTKTVAAVAYFPGSVAGLSVGAPVTFRGVKVGSVKSMRVHMQLSDLQAVIPVYLELDPGQLTWTDGTPAPGDGELRRAVQAGLRAQLVAQSLVTGQLAVDLDFRPALAQPQTAGSGGQETAASVVEIPTVSSDMQHLKDQLTTLNLKALADKASVVLTDLQRILDEFAGKAAPLVQSVQLVAADAHATLQAATAAIRDVQENAVRTLRGVDSLGVAGKRQLAGSGAALNGALARASAALAQAGTLTATLNTAAAARSPERADLQATLRDLAASASALRGFTHDLQRNPAGTLLGHASR